MIREQPRRRKAYSEVGEAFLPWDVLLCTWKCLPGHSPGTAHSPPLPTCDIPMQADTSKQGLWDLALPCLGKVCLLGSVFQQEGIIHIMAVIYTHIFTPLNSKRYV